MLTAIKKTTFSIFILSCLSLFSSSCGDKSNNDEVIKALEESLERSNTSLKHSTATILRSLEDKKTEPFSMDRAIVWFDKASQVKKLSLSIYSHLEELKKVKEMDADDVKKLISNLLKYKTDILETDISIKAEFSQNFPLILDTTTLYSGYFENATPVLISSILTKFQNDVTVAENKLTAFFYTKVGYVDGHSFYPYSALVGQNSNYLKPGDELIITAGVGSFNRAIEKVSVNGVNMNIGEEGYALYKMNVPETAGSYTVPVRLSYFNRETGKESFRSINIQYTVAKECN